MRKGRANGPASSNVATVAGLVLGVAAQQIQPRFLVAFLVQIVQQRRVDALRKLAGPLARPFRMARTA